MKVLGKRDDGTVLVDVGTGTAYRVRVSPENPNMARFANLGDTHAAVKADGWTPVDRVEADGLRPAIRKAMDRGTLVQPDGV